MPVTVMRSLTGMPSSGAADSARLRIASGSCCPAAPSPGGSLNESLSGPAHGSVGSVGSVITMRLPDPRAIPFMLVSGSSVPRFLR